MRTINFNKSELFTALKKVVKPDLKPGEYVNDWDYKISKRGELRGVSLIINDALVIDQEEKD